MSVSVFSAIFYLFLASEFNSASSLETCCLRRKFSLWSSSIFSLLSMASSFRRTRLILALFRFLRSLYSSIGKYRLIFTISVLFTVVKLILNYPISTISSSFLTLRRLVLAPTYSIPTGKLESLSSGKLSGVSFRIFFLAIFSL